MTENQFDELFRNKLKDYSSQVPDNMWEKIHPEKDSDRKLFFIWLKYVIVPVFTLAGLAGGIYLGSRPAAPHSLSHAPASVASSPVFSPNALITSGNSSVPSGRSPVSSGNAPVSSGNAPVLPGNPEIPGAHSSISALTITSTHPASGPVSPIHPPALSIHPRDPSDAPAHYHHNPTPIHSSRKNAFPRITQQEDPLLANADGDLKHLPLPGIQPIPTTWRHPAIAQLPKTTFAPVKKTAAPPPGPKNNILSPLKKGAWSFDLYASPDLPVIQLKQDFEKSQLSFTIGMKVNRSFGDHVSAATGVQYSQINEKVAYNDSSATNPIRYAYLKRTSFDFPLLIGYGIGNDRFRATLNAGMIFKIHSNGNLYTTSNSIYLGVNLAKKINDNISLFAEPYYRYNLPGGSNSQYYIQRINLAGISVGLRYNFKRSGRHKQYDTNN